MAAATKDAVLGAAVEIARQAAVELAEQPGDVGEHLGHVVEGERLVSHRFACTARGYRGWVWTVTLARVARSRTATVCESVLLPGDDAILAPEWLPWSERLRPGDIGPGDVLPFRADDPRLEPGWTPTGDEELDSVAIEELALARARVLSADGRAEAANRWYAGPHGPTSAGSLASAAACGSCGFLVPLQGSLGTVFGVCTNAWSPDDGTVVSIDHGCGAHSETDAEPQASEWPAPDHHLDEHDVELVQLARSAGAAAEAGDATAGDATAVDAASVQAATGDAAAVDAMAVDAPAEDAPAEDAVAEDGTAQGSPADDAAEDAAGAPAGEATDAGTSAVRTGAVLEVASGDAVLDAPETTDGATDPLAGEQLAELGSESDPEPGDATEPDPEPGDATESDPEPGDATEPDAEPGDAEPGDAPTPADETAGPSDAPAGQPEPAAETDEPSREP